MESVVKFENAKVKLNGMEFSVFVKLVMYMKMDNVKRKIFLNLIATIIVISMELNAFVWINFSKFHQDFVEYVHLDFFGMVENANIPKIAGKGMCGVKRESVVFQKLIHVDTINNGMAILVNASKIIIGQMKSV